MQTEVKRSNFSLFLNELVCGGGAAAISKTVVAPLERIKVILQAQNAVTLVEGNRYKGLGDAFARIPKEQGFLSFWRGNGANVLRIIPATAIRFPSFDTYKRISMPNGELGYSGIERVLRKMEAAFFAGLTTLVVTYPLDVAKTRLSFDFARAGAPREYTGVLSCLKKIKKDNGMKAWYRGFFFSVGSTLPFLTVSITVYDILRSSLITGKGEGQVPAFLKYIGLGTIASVVAQLGTYPFDTVRKRLQMTGGADSIYKGSWDCIQKMWAAEGAKGFYAGIVPTVLKIAPAAAVQFAAYDLLKDTVGKNRTL